MANCANDDVGIQALCDMSADYLGNPAFPPGVYPGNTNVRPAGHENVGLEQASLVEPRLADGTVNLTTGKIGLITLGVSNGEQVSQALRQQLIADLATSRKVRLVEACQFGQTLDLVDDPNAPYWTQNVPQALAANGISAAQVQVAWIMQALRYPADWPAFPDHVEVETGFWIALLHNAKAMFPNLRLAFCAGLQFQGYAQQPTILNEPFAFEQHFAVRELLARQIAGDPDFDLSVCPWLDMSELWCNGVIARSDGLTWTCPDANPDGVHCSQAGANKLATWIRTGWKLDPVAQPWLLA